MIRVMVTLIIMSVLTFYLPGQQTIDFSEKILQFQKINCFGNQGFGLYDTGDNKYKIFDWNLNKTAEIPIRIGEGKAEIIYPDVTSFILNRQLYINSSFSNIISVFDLNGKFARDFKIESKSTGQMILFNKNLYVFNEDFFIDKKDKFSELLRIIEPISGKTLKTIPYREKIKIPEKYSMKSNFLSGMFLFKLDRLGRIYILDPINLFIYMISQVGTIQARIKLPFQPEVKYTEILNQGNKSLVRQIMAEYTSFIIYENKYYALFKRFVFKDKNMRNVKRKVSLLKFEPNGTYKEKFFEGNLRILDENNGVLYLYDDLDFFFIRVDLKNWK